MDKNKRIIDYFLSNKDKLAYLNEKEIKDLLYLSSSMAIEGEDYLLKNKACKLLYSCCFETDLDIKELWNIYWIISRKTFSDAHISISENLDELYKYIYEKIERLINLNLDKLETPNKNLIILITSQFLQVEHAPTRRVLDYAYILVKKLGKQVVIINDSGLNYYPCRCLVQDVNMNFMDIYNKTENIKYKDVIVPYMQISAYMPDIYCMKEMLMYIYDLNPGLIYNIGGSSLLADLCGKFAVTASLPCSTDIPITMSKYLLVGRTLQDSDSDRIKRLESYQQIIETVINYVPVDNKVKYEREKYGLKESDFVIIVIGNRLDSEIDTEFLSLMNKIIKEENVHIMFVGNLSQKDKIERIVSNKEKLHFIGQINNANKMIAICNLYCNPKRSGGGRSSFEALHSGVPVVTLKYGDVYYTCGNTFTVQNYGEYFEKVQQYIYDKQYMGIMKTKAKKRAEYLSDIEKTQKDILDKIL